MSTVYENENNSIETLLKQVELLIEKNDDIKLSEYIERIHYADLSEIIMELDDEKRNIVFAVLSIEDAAKVLEEIDSDVFVSLMSSLSIEQKRRLIDIMSLDDIVDQLGELSETEQKDIISHMDIEDAKDVKELLVYEDDTAGGIMTTDYIAVGKNLTAYKAIESLRKDAEDAETVYYVYVVDENEKLVGVMSLRELILASPTKKVEDIMNDNVIKVYVDEDQEDVARKVSKYDLLAIPVTDGNKMLKGIITVDDVIDVIEEEATEDILKFAGTSEEISGEENLIIKIFNSIKSRLPWLIVTIFGGLVSARIMSEFQGTLNANTTLALFVPILAGMGGNAGTQSSTITVRSIAMGNIVGKEAIRTVIQEISVGFFVGLICSAIVGIASFYLKGEMLLSVIVALAMWANMLTATFIGTIVPLIFKKIGVDPAVASAPFITTTVDITGLTIYFTLATVMIVKLL
ncbi:MAG: magnesium transporter [Firmicutes bacterium]|jgi:magnesium transporter|nr:magnesium transporter [Bacillota bacterium]